MATVVSERPAPTVWAIAFATAILAGLSGYFLGQASSIGIFAKSEDDIKELDAERDLSDSESDEDDDLLQQEVKDFDNHKEECKLVLVVRTDLGMTKGACYITFSGHATSCVRLLANICL